MTRVLLAIVLASIAVLGCCNAQAQELKKLAGSVRRGCLKESGTTVEVLDAAEGGEFPDDRKLACYFKCVLEKFNMISKNDEINFSLMRKVIPEEFKEMGNEMIDECADSVGNDRCELAFNFNKCMFYANPVAYFVV